MTNPSRLDAPEIRAVLEANRAKLAMMQKTSNDILKDVSVRNNPVYGEEPTGTPQKLSSFLRAIPPSSSTGHQAQPPSPVSHPGDLKAPPTGPDGLFDAKPPQIAASTDQYVAMPAWDSQRPFLTGTFLLSPPSSAPAPTPAVPPLQSYPHDVQESLLVDDLLYAFVGLESRYIKVVKQQQQHLRVQFRLRIDGRLDPALSEMTIRMLPICECVAIISRFVEMRRRYDAGVVAQGLASGMRGVLHDWELMVAQLEHQAMRGNLTLQALWYYVQSPYAALRLVAKLASECWLLRGAAILDVLHVTATSSPVVGDSAAVTLAQRLLRVSSQPYFAMLGRWIYEGTVDDPYEEFMVEEDASIGRDDLSTDGSSAFWSDKFKLRERESRERVKDVPAFLIKEAQTILDVGKAVCLSRTSAITVDRKVESIKNRRLFLAGSSEWHGGSDCEFGWGSSTSCLVAIARAKQEAALAATAILKTEALEYPTGLKCLKKYFLAAQGDVLLGLMDGGESEMDQMSGNVSLYQLQTMLDVAIKTSSAACDSAAAHLRATYDHRSVLNMLIAITQKSMNNSYRQFSEHVPSHLRQKLVREAFMLWYQPPWPLSVLVPDVAMAQYQMMFRHIFELKWVERELNAASMLLANTKFLANSHRRFSSSSSSSAVAARVLKSAYATCQVMTHFFRQYLLYATFEVIEPLWRGLEGQLMGAETVDEMLVHHQSFLSKAMKGLLLSRKVVVLRSLLSLKQLALDFVALMACLDINPKKDDMLGGEVGQMVLGRAQREDFLVKGLSDTTFASSLRDIHAKFESRCGEFMASLAEAHEQARTEQTETREELEGLVNLTSRLDFNGYFSRRGITRSS
jgi:gamma-tubulin complex component 2